MDRPAFAAGPAAVRRASGLPWRPECEWPEAVKVTFAATQLHALGDLTVVDGVDYEPAPPALATRARRWLRVRIETDRAPGYTGHRAAIMDALTAVKASPAGLLVWTDDEERTTLLSRPVLLAGTSLPEDLNAEGVFEQGIELTFAWEEPLTSQAVTSSYTPTGGSAVNLGRIVAFNEGAVFTRPSELRNIRTRVGGKVSLSGKLDADPTLDLAARRTALAALKTALDAAFDARTGTLVHGGFFSRLVRPVSRNVVVNQAEWCLDWSFEGEFTRFPDEADYLLVDFTLKTREGKEAGTLERTLAGSIGAPTELAAVAKLNALVAVQEAAGYQVTERDEDPQTVETPDGTEFITLGFSVQFRKRASATVVRATVTAGDAEDLGGGMVARRYAGSVTARSAASWADAYTEAVAKARLLGDNRHVFRLRRSLEIADNQQSMGAAPQSMARVTTGDWLVTVNFSFEYRVKAARFLWEVNAEEQRPRFGQRTLAVSGSISAVDRATADLHYAAIKACFLPAGTTNFLRDERLSERKELAPRTAAEPLTGLYLVGGNVNVNTGEALPDDVTATLNGVAVPQQKLTPAGASYPVYQQFGRLEFGFVLLQPRGVDDEVAVSYELRIDSDLIRLTKHTSLSGEVFASNDAACATALTLLLAGFNVAADFGKLVKSVTGQRREKFYGQVSPTYSNTADDRPTGTALSGTPALAEGYRGVLVGYSFAQEYEGRVAGDGAVIECRLNEQLQHSGANVVVASTAFGNDTFQLCGVASARRVLSGSATAATESVARAWCVAALGTEPPGTPTGVSLAVPPEFTTEWEVEPRTELVARGVSANARLVRVNFSRTFHYESLPYTG